MLSKPATTLLSHASLLILALLASSGGTYVHHGTYLASFDPVSTSSIVKNVHVSYDLDSRAEKFLVHVPENYSEGFAYGVLVYLDPADRIDAMPAGWENVNDSRNLIFIAPEKVGNKQSVNRRL